MWKHTYELSSYDYLQAHKLHGVRERLCRAQGIPLGMRWKDCESQSRGGHQENMIV